MNLCIMPRPSGIIRGKVSDFFISDSVFNALVKMKLKMDATDNNELTEICKMYNPHEYVFSNVIDTPVSKLNPASNLYYELHEIFNTFGLFKTLHKISQILHVEKEPSLITPFYLLVNKNITTHCTINDIENISNSDFIFIDLDVDLMLAFDVIFRLLNNEGVAIIKLTSIYNKQTISILYLLSIIFEKTFIVKPSIINVLSNDVFILCISRNDKLIMYEDTLSIIIPTIFLCKIEEFNSVNGHRQLDAYEQIFNLLHNKNRINKLELLKKTNIQKSIAWCEKHNIPHNKFGDKINMFL